MRGFLAVRLIEPPIRCFLLFEKPPGPFCQFGSEIWPASLCFSPKDGRVSRARELVFPRTDAEKATLATTRSPRVRSSACRPAGAGFRDSQIFSVVTTVFIAFFQGVAIQ